jgi:hypothetical protein
MNETIDNFCLFRPSIRLTLLLKNRNQSWKFAYKCIWNYELVIRSKTNFYCSLFWKCHKVQSDIELENLLKRHMQLNCLDLSSHVFKRFKMWFFDKIRLDRFLNCIFRFSLHFYLNLKNKLNWLITHFHTCFDE